MPAVSHHQDFIRLTTFLLHFWKKNPSACYSRCNHIEINPMNESLSLFLVIRVAEQSLLVSVAQAEA
jgi:hypothetical protein